MSEFNIYEDFGRIGKKYIEDCLDVNYASFKYKCIMKEIYNFEQALDNEHEIALNFISLGKSKLMVVKDIGYQNPDLLYFYGVVDGEISQVIQHTTQLNFLITSVKKQDLTKPTKRIGFISEND